MLVELRQETPCYYSSPQHLGTIRGQFIYIYEGRGILHINEKGLRLTRKPQTLDLPFKDIKSVGVRPFSRWVKPGGLTYIVVKFANEWNEESEIHLIPFRSPFDPTWTTSLIVQSWYETLRDQPELQGRIEPPTFDAGPISVGMVLGFATICFVVPFAFMVLAFMLLFSL